MANGDHPDRDACACTDRGGYFYDLVDDKVRMRSRIRELEDQARRDEARQRTLVDRCAAAERELSVLAAVHAAASAVHESLDRELLHRAIHDIARNIGCDAHAIFETTGRPFDLAPSGWRGVDIETIWALSVNDLVLEVAREGSSVIAEGRAIERTTCGKSIAACIALMLEGRVTGVLVLLGMRPEKQRFTVADRAMLGVLEAHTAVALFASRCYARDRPTSRPPLPTA